VAAVPKDGRCGGCGAILSLERPEVFFQPLRVDAEKINAALERLERVDPTRDGGVALQMGMAYLNLKQPDMALGLLRQAVAQLSEAEFTSQVEALAAYRDGLAPSPEPGRRQTILVVDDSPTIRRLVTMTLERRGYLTRTAGTGYEAIDVLRDWGVPDLILLDIALPGMDGYELCRLLRQNIDTTNVPIVLLAGKDGFFTKVRGRLAGCSESISKPFELEGLLRVVERHCPLHQPTFVPAWPARR
jgi:twitching motility two-component system response regulator PilG